MKSKIVAITIALLTALAATTTTVSALQGKRIKEQEQVISGQGAIIDSLLSRRMTVFDVSLSVADNSKLTIYGKKSQNLNVPAAKTYILKLDSVSLHTLEK